MRQKCFAFLCEVDFPVYPVKKGNPQLAFHGFDLSGNGSLMVNVIRNTLLLKIDEWKWVKSRMTMAAITALLALVTAVTWAGPLSLLPFISVGVTTAG